MALETAERHERPSCSECSDLLRRRRGCRKPGYNVEGSMAFRFTSPDISEDKAIVRECPVGMLIRECPYIYDVINACGLVESGCVDLLHAPLFLQSAYRVVSSERSRLRELKDKDRQTKRDSEYGRHALGA